jgi:hypothetical protein
MNMKLKLLNPNTDVYFSGTCLEQNIISKYTRVKLIAHNKYIAEHTE